MVRCKKKKKYFRTLEFLRNLSPKFVVVTKKKKIFACTLPEEEEEQERIKNDE